MLVQGIFSSDVLLGFPGIWPVVLSTVSLQQLRTQQEDKEFFFFFFLKKSYEGSLVSGNYG